MDPSTGWYVNSALLPDLFEGNPVPTDPKRLEKKLCDIDIREYADPCLTSHMSKEALNGPVVLQLTRFRNVSQPKVKEDVKSSNDVVRLSLTDGHTSVSAVLLESVKGLTVDTPPGTKVLISGTLPVEGGFIMLAPQNITIIGGRVESLIEKWNVERHSLGDGSRGKRSDCTAPKWISFGKRGTSAIDASTKDFKANEVLASTKKTTDDQSSFEQQRKENIDALGDGSTKVFAAPKVQVPPKQPESSNPRPAKTPAATDRGHDRRGKKGRRRGGDSDDEEVPAEFARPSKPSTLFDFVASNVAPGVEEALRGMPARASHPQQQQNDFRQEKESARGYVPFKGRGDGRSFDKGPSSRGRGRGPAAEQRVPNAERGTYGSSNRPNRGPSERNIPYGQKNYDGGDQNRRRDQGNSSQPSTVSSQRSQRNQGQSRDPQNNQRSGNQQSFNMEFKNSQRNYGPSNSSMGFQQDRLVSSFSNMRVNDGFNTRQPNMANRPPFDAGLGRPDSTVMPKWKVGAKCMAPWSDGMYYIATIVSLEPADMCVVRYTEYGNIGTVPQAVLLYV
ncbi:hypothetical protein Q1695_001892 [Nippostrongylus brasiliensis]|nr:hypothetical protein Q1695_001892 [Nippostrongylus brasiliensis]